MLFYCKSKVFVTHSLAFFRIKAKGKSVSKAPFLWKKKTNQAEMGNLKRRQCSVCLISECRNEQIPKRRSDLYKN